MSVPLRYSQHQYINCLFARLHVLIPLCVYVHVHVLTALRRESWRRH